VVVLGRSFRVSGQKVDMVERIRRHKTSFFFWLRRGSKKFTSYWVSPSRKIMANIQVRLKEDIFRWKREIDMHGNITRLLKG
jgi:hypothetical protein